MNRNSKTHDAASQTSFTMSSREAVLGKSPLPQKLTKWLYLIRVWILKLLSCRSVWSLSPTVPKQRDSDQHLVPQNIGVADGILLVGRSSCTHIVLMRMQIYDITSRRSFEALPQLVKRIQELKNSSLQAPPLKIVVVGNKRDLEPSREVPIQDGMTYAASLGAPFFETSAKEGTNVEESFNLLIRECIGDPGCSVM